MLNKVNIKLLELPFYEFDQVLILKCVFVHGTALEALKSWDNICFEDLTCYSKGEANSKQFVCVTKTP